ncbi:IclR family transcriptional regulator [Ruegeria sp. ANG-R]|uniref:IclR family transcriptional regulator n=1 Tax=Ruegeria sp. ANG-R TaxID=1577903 RepID=UPI00057E94B7|nr:IclR family transcriptional regulator [Ruegeria sp. ANG-R]KIC40184.1 IclR family transcriptional regulator [Ruegeria sp. ANG-R]
MSKDGKPKTKARGLDRAFAILDHLCQVGLPQRPIEIAEGMGAPKSSIYDLVALLLASNVLEKIDADGRVFLGPKLNFWSTNYRKHFDLGGIVRPILENVTARTRETSQFCTLDGDKYYVAMMNEGNRPFRISADVGERTPIPWTASGRLLISHLSDQEIIDLIPEEDFHLPDGSYLEPSSFIESVRKANADQFFDFDSIADNFTHCFAAPVYGLNNRCIYTLCIIAPQGDAEKNYDEYRSALVEAAEILSKKLTAQTSSMSEMAAE